MTDACEFVHHNMLLLCIHGAACADRLRSLTPAPLLPAEETLVAWSGRPGLFL